MKNVVDRRLLLVRNIAAHSAAPGKSPSTAPHVKEFELFIDVASSGELDFGPYTLTRWDVIPPTKGASRSLILRVFEHILDLNDGTPATREGFYHGISLPQEFCTFASVVFRRRIRLGPLVRQDDKALRIPPASRAPSRSLTDGRMSLPDLGQGLSLLVSLPPTHHEPFILACRMYEEALSAINEKPDLAYLLLVSCIEVFVAKYAPSTTLASAAPDIVAAVESHPDEAARQVLTKKLCTDRMLSKHFVTFTENHISDSFWQASSDIRPEDGRVERSEIRTLLKRIYDRRSRTLHTAEAFPPHVLDPPNDYAEIDRRESVSVGNRVWKASDTIPYVTFFERLVNDVLNSFLRSGGPRPWPAPAPPNTESQPTSNAQSNADSPES